MSNNLYNNNINYPFSLITSIQNKIKIYLKIYLIILIFDNFVIMANYI